MKLSLETTLGIAESINSYLIRAIQIGRSSATVQGFLASVDAEDPNPYRNYAVPFAGTHPSSHDVSALVQWFYDRCRKPRLEYMVEAAPAVEAALIAAGFSVEGRLPLLTVQKTHLHSTAVIGIDIQAATTETELREAAIAQNAAYGGSETTQVDVDRLMSTVARGGAVVVAREAHDGRVVGAGLYPPPVGGLTEIAAVGVLEEFRRRGIASALSAALASSAFDQGIATPFLMAASPAEQLVYERAGFVKAGHIIHVSLCTSPEG